MDTGSCRSTQQTFRKPHSALAQVWGQGKMQMPQFKRMPLGLTGAPGYFQCLIDKIMCGLPFVTTNTDDVLLHSKSEEQHKHRLQQVFQCLSDAGLTLRGYKCTLTMAQVTYLNVLSLMVSQLYCQADCTLLVHGDGRQQCLFRSQPISICCKSRLGQS